MQISPYEQNRFLDKLTTHSLPVSEKSHEMTKNILFSHNLEDGWKVHGKTGSVYKILTDKTQIGWFVGWIQKDKRIIIFSSRIDDKNILDYSGRKLAKENAIKGLIKLTRQIT